ncbi:HAD family hydrolase [Lacibacter sp. MH-610]|uniref:HAD family hydrolase n=1 Tax=Lacibacter sp. MH-610 TaxID=3020883 RepID=UPI003891F707
MIVSFDFDNTLSRKDVQDYAKELISRGIKVWVITSRFDELHKHRYPHNPTIDDLWEVVDQVGIPRWRVRFTCMESKSLYLMHTKVIWHLDDDIIELSAIKYDKCKTVGINVKSGGWKQKCERILKRFL